MKNLLTENFRDKFGTIKPPEELNPFVAGDPSGAAGLSKFFTNLIALIYSAAAVVFLLMIVWGAWDWLTSGGEKEKIQAAQRKIINALVGILLFAAAFAIISAFGTFTGFRFFNANCPPGSFNTTSGGCADLSGAQD